MAIVCTYIFASNHGEESANLIKVYSQKLCASNLLAGPTELGVQGVQMLHQILTDIGAKLEKPFPSKCLVVCTMATPRFPDFPPALTSFYIKLSFIHSGSRLRDFVH